MLSNDAKPSIPDSPESPTPEPTARLVPIQLHGYESVARYAQGDFNALFAVHTSIGNRAVGTICIAPLPGEDLGLERVIEAATTATYKNIIAETGLGGCAMVVFADPRERQIDRFWNRVGDAIEAFQMTRRTHFAFPNGIDLAGIRLVRAVTPDIVGLPLEAGGSGDPTPFIGLGALAGLRAVVKELDGTDSLANKTVTIAGIRNAAGIYLAEHLREAGAQVIIAEPENRFAQIFAEAGFQVASSSTQFPCDILVPSGSRERFSRENVSALKCRAIAGIHMGGFLDRAATAQMQSQGVLLLPDYLIAAGGYINIATELRPAGYSESAARIAVNRIYDLTRQLLDRARHEGIPPLAVANRIVQDRIRENV